VTAQSPGPNQGSTFTLTFPLATVRPPAPKPPAPPPVREGHLNILLVEDHKDTRIYIQRLLEAASHRISSAATADEALKLAETNRFDLVISDLGLPDLTGHELMRRLHARFGLPGIALSGYGMENDVEESRKSGFKYHLTKPVSFDRLKSLVAEFTGNRQKA
jgi:CheY-like chemotaxis protein